MPSKFLVGDLVRVDCLPEKPNSVIWKKSEDHPHLGIIVDIIESSTMFFDECLSVKISNGDVITLSPNMVKPIDDEEK